MSENSNTFILKTLKPDKKSIKWDPEEYAISHIDLWEGEIEFERMNRSESNE